MSDKNTVITDTIHGSIVISNMEKKIISHSTFNRLHDVYQNSTVYLTFPCNRTKRFEHSLGTMKLCNDIFCNSIRNTNLETENEFFSKYQKELLEILKLIKQNKYNHYSSKLGGRINKLDPNKIPSIGEESILIFNFPKQNQEYRDIYTILLQAIRIAALLHDVGHPPYSHIVEFALKYVREAYTGRKDNQRIEEFNSIMDGFFTNNKKKLHEQMGDKIVDILLSDAISDIKEEDIKKAGIYEKQVAEILIKEVVERILTNTKPFDQLHRIIDGTLDGDRLDYVTRDALNSGLNKGKIEYDRLFCGMAIVKHNDEFWFAPNIKALNTLEDYLYRRWEVYKNVIFHHRVIKTDYLLENVVGEICKAYLDGDINGETIDSQSDLLPADISGLWRALKSSTNTDSAYAISQWDDSWLMTVLKKHYFKDFIDKDIPKYNILSKQLSELLTNRKCYFSVIKRLEDFLVIDQAIAEGICSKKAELNEKIKELEKCSEKFKEKDLEIKTETVTIQPFINNMMNILLLAEKVQERDKFAGLVFSHLRKEYRVLYDANVPLSDLMTTIIKDVAKLEFPQNSIEDIFCVIKKYDIGLKKPLILYEEKIGQAQYQVSDIYEVSSISKILNFSYDTFPQFFIYILKTHQYQNTKLEVEQFLKKVGNEIAQKFYDHWLRILNQNINTYNEKSEIEE